MLELRIMNTVVDTLLTHTRGGKHTAQLGFA